jgi:hypothetical protein
LQWIRTTNIPWDDGFTIRCLNRSANNPYLVLHGRIELPFTGWKPVILTDRWMQYVFGTENWTWTSGLTLIKRLLYQLSYLRMVLEAGLEPTTYWVQNNCSTRWAIPAI